ncbi:hypothetical protein KGA66_07790 [Actinocrinis puniceicyclus]|uniref:Uncharacterized protein n=1 Tax=Actinocrinis puniceicyclus TaxID=977794 RepID=A0A8J7WP07_9ACTN|nr:hypothetical protein [Actinocrinis puniceicyclus]MBS2962940.1 hypothetical protein [Actinocrinis puniceicyclus]
MQVVTIAAEQRVPNKALRRVRIGLGMSQSEFAGALRKAGEAAGEPNKATKRLVQKWESGEHAWCRPQYGRALQAVTGLSHQQLGLAMYRNEYSQPQRSARPTVNPDTAAGPLDRMQRELKRAPGEEDERLARIGGQLVAGGQAAALGGWLALGSGDAAGAQRYFSAALAAARALSATAQSD